MQLKDTVELMTSSDWKDRFLAEYLQTKIRHDKLEELIARRIFCVLDFETPIPMSSWSAQLKAMEEYLHELEMQAAIHGIKLPNVHEE